jgi:hypothetical protein
MQYCGLIYNDFITSWLLQYRKLQTGVELRILPVVIFGSRSDQGGQKQTGTFLGIVLEL